MKCPDTIQTAEDYLAWVSEDKRDDLREIHEAIRKAAPALEPAIIYGMIGYGPHHYKTKSGCEGEWFVVGLAEQKNNLALYLCACNEDGYLVEQNKNELGKVSCGKSCIRFKKLVDLNLPLAMKLVKETAKLHHKKGEKS